MEVQLASLIPSSVLPAAISELVTCQLYPTWYNQIQLIVDATFFEVLSHKAAQRIDLPPFDATSEHDRLLAWCLMRALLDLERMNYESSVIRVR